MAESISLAVLENLVHMSRGDFPEGFVVVAATIPFEFSSWSDLKPEIASQLRSYEMELIEDQRTWGDVWIASRAAAVLEVPSMVVPGESNFLMNPNHPDFAKIIVDPPVPFAFDPRLFRI